LSSVFIVKVGAKTPLGLSALQTGFLLRAGFPALGEAPLANASGEAITMGWVPTIDPRLTSSERLAELAEAPFMEAIEPVRDATVEIYIALDEACEDVAAASWLLKAMVTRALPGAKAVTVEARGEAAPAVFLPMGIRALEARQADVVVIGGVHSDYDPRAIQALEAGGRLFSRENLDARIPGEAAAFFALMRRSDAARRGLSPLARVLGVGKGRESARPDNDEPAFAAFGLTAAVREATGSLARDGKTAGWFLTDMTGEVRRINEWQATFARVQEVLGRPYWIESPAHRIGYLGAAAMPLFAAIAATAWEHGYAPASVALSTAGTDGGDRAALVLEKT
jgi:3-oxoacyl-[acyl-carrier-protein] synthase-1